MTRSRKEQEIENADFSEQFFYSLSVFVGGFAFFLLCYGIWNTDFRLIFIGFALIILATWIWDRGSAWGVTLEKLKAGK